MDIVTYTVSWGRGNSQCVMRPSLSGITLLSYITITAMKIPKLSDSETAWRRHSYCVVGPPHGCGCGNLHCVMGPPLSDVVYSRQLSD